MTRLWTCVSGYDDAAGLDRACASVRAAWPDADEAPIVYSDGAYEDFPSPSPGSGGDVISVARRWATFIIDWPARAPTEFLKRTSYFAGAEGDLALVLDTDEEVSTTWTAREIAAAATHTHHLVPFVDAATGRESGANVRLFRVCGGLHHWGSHESAFAGGLQLRRAGALRFDGLRIVHHGARTPERRAAKRAYYERLAAAERGFRRLVGA